MENGGRRKGEGGRWRTYNGGRMKKDRVRNMEDGDWRMMKEEDGGRRMEENEGGGWRKQDDEGGG